MRTPEGHHTTNYADTLITLAADTKATSAVPPPAGKGTVAERQFAMLAGHDYEFTSDDVIFTVHADRAAIPPGERAAAGRVALVPVGSARYDELLADESTTKTQAMRSSR